MNAELTKQIKAARRVSVPIVAITTPDPAATITTVSEAINGGQDGKPAPKIVWDILEGMRPRGNNQAEIDAAKTLIANITGDGGSDPTIANPAALLTAAQRFPENAVLFMHLGHRWLSDPTVIQGVWNLRDQFKQDRRMLILLAPTIELPAELAGDVVVFDEALPGSGQLADIIGEQFDAAGLSKKTDQIKKGVEAIQGLPAFQAEQVVAMSLTKDGLDLGQCWERKRRQIELTPGLKVHRDPVRFTDIGGVPIVKEFLARILNGQSRPNAIVFIDEIEKFMAGAAGGHDTSGVSQDQLGTLLSYMQDNAAAGCIFIGPPGSAKSMVAKACGNETGVPTIQLDLGGMKGSLVGQSEQNLRAGLKVISSVSNGKSLWIATCNSIADLPPELRRRFTLGTFFFDLPDAEERKLIWKLYLKKYELSSADLKGVEDEGWTGAEIRQACDIAWRINGTLKEASGFIVPVSRSASDQIERLRKAAEGRFLSASHLGVYRRGGGNEIQPTKNQGRRAMAIAE